MKRYGFSASGATSMDHKMLSLYQWWDHDDHFDLSTHPNESNGFGHVVEIDPTDPAAPKAISDWPEGPSGGRPRPATIVIQGKAGGLTGS